MIESAVLDAIARVIAEDGGVERALALLRRGDPLLRGASSRRLREAHADALLATRLKQGPEAAGHALRLTYLLLLRALPPRAVRDDVDAIGAAYEAARAARPTPSAGRWWPTGLLVLALAAAGVAATFSWRAATRAPPPEPVASSSASSAPVTVSGAYADGGVPAPSPGDAVLARALGTDVPDFLVALDQRTEARRAGAPAAELGKLDALAEGAQGRALAPDVRAALGEAAARALEDLLAAARRAAEGPAGGSPAGFAPRASELDGALARAVAAFDDALAAAGLGYFADGDVITETDSGRRYVIVYTFRVSQVRVFAAGAATVRALELRRLDKLSWSHTLLGFTRPTLRFAAVLLDQLDEQVVTLIAPAMAPGAPVPLFEPDASAPDRAAVEARAGELVRAEYGALPGLDLDAATRLGKLLGKRRALFASWEPRLSARGLAVAAPVTLRLPRGLRASLEGLVPGDDLFELMRIDAALDDQTRADAFVALRDALAASVERHEVQHRLDALGPPPPLPKALEALVGPLEDAGRERRDAVAARAELSAYLAELARDARTPRVGLTLIARFLFDRRMHGAPECYAALVLLEGLADGLGVRVAHPLVAAGAIDRHAVAEVWGALVALPPERLRAAARTLWEALFAAPLPDLRLVAPEGDPPR